MKHTPTIVSVDWDWFLPFSTDHRYDWGHHEENPFFYEAIWAVRSTPFPESMMKEVAESWGLEHKPQVPLEQQIQIDPEQVRTFWCRTLKSGYPKKVCVQDSHGRIPEFIKPIARQVHLINFDAHHDAGYNQTRKQDCSNWAYFLKKQGKLASYTLVYPKWRKKEPEGEKIPAIVDRVIYGDWTGEKLSAYGVYICRSSCWMPPWLDPLWLILKDTLLFRGPMSGFTNDYAMKARPWPPTKNPA